MTTHNHPIMPLTRSFRPGHDRAEMSAMIVRGIAAIPLDAVVTAYFRCDYFRRPTFARPAVVVDRY
jgi:hypothetical protein